MGKLILFPTHEDYCNECIYYNKKIETCNNPEYNDNCYKVCCVWKHCKYKRKRLQQEDK